MRAHTSLIITTLAVGLAAGLLIARLQEQPQSVVGEPGLSLNFAMDEVETPQVPPTAGVDELALEIAFLRKRVEELERPETRQPVASEATVTSGPIPSVDERAKILAVMEQVEDERRQERDLLRAQKMEAEIRRRAVRVADKLQLPTGSEDRIASIFLAEQEQVALVRKQYKGVGLSPEDRLAYRDAINATRTKRDEELGRYFGNEVAKLIGAASSEKPKRRADRGGADRGDARKQRKNQDG